MMKRNANSYTNGTSALEIPRWVEYPDEATIIKFPTSRDRIQDKTASSKEDCNECASRTHRGIKRVLESSEMYCSLRFESVWGVPYNLFTRAAIGALSSGAAFIGLVSLILGA